MEPRRDCEVGVMSTELNFSGADQPEDTYNALF